MFLQIGSIGQKSQVKAKQFQTPLNACISLKGGGNEWTWQSEYFIRLQQPCFHHGILTNEENEKCNLQNQMFPRFSSAFTIGL